MITALEIVGAVLLYAMIGGFLGTYWYQRALSEYRKDNAEFDRLPYYERGAKPTKPKDDQYFMAGIFWPIVLVILLPLCYLIDLGAEVGVAAAKKVNAHGDQRDERKAAAERAHQEFEEQVRKERLELEELDKEVAQDTIRVITSIETELKQ